MTFCKLLLCAITKYWYWFFFYFTGILFSDGDINNDNIMTLHDTTVSNTSSLSDLGFSFFTSTGIIFFFLWEACDWTHHIIGSSQFMDLIWCILLILTPEFLLVPIDMCLNNVKSEAGKKCWDTKSRYEVSVCSQLLLINKDCFVMQSFSGIKQKTRGTEWNHKLYIQQNMSL